MNKVIICDNPLLQHRLTILRDKQTPYPEFRRALRECGALMGFEIGRELPTEAVRVETPLESTTARKLAGHVSVIAILRAAIGFVEGLAQYLPDAKIGHLGLYRDEETLKPVRYYEKLPADIAAHPVILADPMLATGGSLVAALDNLHEMGCNSNIRVATLLAAPEGIARLRAHYPKTPLYVAAVDRELNEKGFILPGLGDAGDRQYGTL